ncbi:MAG: protein-export rane protein SecD/SecF family [Paenibacillus sp.]|nr:protein-export rane protein SecD/SecF family [Paenibacillus sp.]
MVNYKRVLAFLLTVAFTISIVVFTTPNVISNVRLGLDLKGGFEVLYEAEPLHEGDVITMRALRETARSLEKRVNALGTTEPEINTEGANRIRIRLAGVEDEHKVREILKTPAELTVRGPDGKVELNGSDFVEGAAEVVFDELNRANILVKVKDKDKLKEISTRLLHQPIAFQLDDVQLAVPVIQVVLPDGATRITGNFTFEEAKELADTVNLGSLPLKLTEKYAQSVGASLGQRSLDQTLEAGIYASIFILLFMLALYRIPGLVASITLITYSWLLLLVMNLINATLTLPGIAAFVLGIGMAVDANIITYERLKDELRTGKGLSSALKAGSKHSVRTIMDANITTVVAGAVLFYVGTGAIKGFALTLMLSIGLSVLTNVYLSQLLLRMLVKMNVFVNLKFFGVNQNELTDRHDNVSTLKASRSFDFVGKRKMFFIISIVVTLLGVGSLLVQKMNYGVDFKAGTTLDISLGQPIDKTKAEEIARSAGFEPSVVTVGGEKQDRVTLRFDRVLNEGLGETQKVMSAFAAQYGDNIDKEENTVDPGIAKELAIKALIAVAVACLGIILYMCIRFEWRFAVAGIIALLHDAFFVVSIFSILRLEVNLPFIAAILTIIGYSINDTVVIFDRIRENLRFARIKTFKELSDLVNLSINQTLVRSINTGITVLFASLALQIWGSESISLFSVAMTIGLVIGMYSSIYIASQLWLILKGRTLKNQPDERDIERKTTNNQVNPEIRQV